MGQSERDVGAGQGAAQEGLGAADAGSASLTAEEIEAGRRLFAQETTFFTSVADTGHLPPADRPEVAFAGRSNVGKSSLVNALAGRRALARTSHTPGRTQTLNFYDQGPGLRLVDLPGYGYARASKQAVREWTALILDYLAGRATLARVFLLIDARHGIKPADADVMVRLDRAAVSYQVVLTKADKAAAADLDRLTRRMAAILARHGAAHPHILATSARQREGLDELRAVIATLVPN